MRPLEAGNTPRKVRPLDRSHGTGLSRHHEGDEEFRDLLDDALDREPREPQRPAPEGDRVELTSETTPAAGFDDTDRVEIGGRPATTVAAYTPEPETGIVPDADVLVADGPVAAGPAQGGRNRLDLKA